MQGGQHGRRPRILRQPDVACAHRPLDAGGSRCALPHGMADLRRDDEIVGLSRHQPDGQGADDPARQDGRHRSRRDLRLSRRCLPGRGPCTADRQARRLLSLDVLCSRAAGNGGLDQGLQSQCAEGARAQHRLRQLRIGDGRPLLRRHAASLHHRRDLHRRRRLCRRAYQLGPAIRHAGSPAGISGLLGSPQGAPGQQTRDRHRRREMHRQLAAAKG